MEQETKNTKPENPQAFPCHNDLATKYNEHGQSYGAETGMTLRDYFAAKAMQSLITISPNTDVDRFRDIIAAQSYMFADAMLNERIEP